MTIIKFNHRLTIEQGIDLDPAIKKGDSYHDMLSTFRISQGELCTKSYLAEQCKTPKQITQILLMLILEKKINRYYLRLTKDSTFHSFYVYGDVNPARHEQEIIGFDVFSCSQEHLFSFLKQHPMKGFTLKELRQIGFEGSLWDKLKKLWNKGLIVREKIIVTYRPQHRYYYYSSKDIERLLVKDKDDEKNE
ncbi:MAG: hypothetical protein V3U54_13315 [Thermodesulfobacteriota bacterium]